MNNILHMTALISYEWKLCLYERAKAKMFGYIDDKELNTSF